MRNIVEILSSNLILIRSCYLAWQPYHRIGKTKFGFDYREQKHSCQIDEHSQFSFDLTKLVKIGKKKKAEPTFFKKIENKTCEFVHHIKIN